MSILYCLFLRILHVQIHSACTCSRCVCVHGIFKYGGASLWQAPLGPSLVSYPDRFRRLLFNYGEKGSGILPMREFFHPRNHKYADD